MSENQTASMSFIPKPALGYLCAFAITFVWAGWLVTSRAGVQSSLTIYDIMAFRFGISAIIALPVVLYFRSWVGMTFKQIAVTSFVLGVPYTTILFAAFNYAPASHGGVFMNGILPALTAVLAYIIYKERPHKGQILGGILIIIGATLAAFGTVGFDFALTWRGDLMFVIAGIFFATYIMINRVWHFTTTQIWICGSIVNAAIYMPFYLIAGPSGISEAPTNLLILQMVYQGIIPNIIGLVLIAVSVRHVGPTITAAIMSGVPGLSSLLGYFLLGEQLSWLGIISLLILTPGILIASAPKKMIQKYL